MRLEWLMNVKSPIILAIDTPDISRAHALIEATAESVGGFKFGLEFYLRNGISTMLDITSRYPGIQIFLDLKLHDIPNTVAGACESVREIAPRFLTVHASGGHAMIERAAQTLPATEITAVTVLTSLNQGSLEAMGIDSKIAELCLTQSKRAVEAGARAIVSSPHEVAAIRAGVGEGVTLITPGVRPEGASSDDQERVMTPRQAIESGATFVVIGRPISGATDPGRAAHSILESIIA